MEQESVLLTYINDGDPFACYIVQHPPVAHRVDTCLITLKHLEGSRHIADLMAMRDAANQLCMTAFQYQFYDHAAVYVRMYERYCLALLPYSGVR